MTDKKDFLKNKLTPMFLQLAPEQPGRWGKMKAQQMVEHMSDYVRIASGKRKVTALNSEEVTAKMHAFMMSEKPFRENTPNPLLPDVPPPAKHASMGDAVRDLQQEIDDFFMLYESNPGMQFLQFRFVLTDCIIVRFKFETC